MQRRSVRRDDDRERVGDGVRVARPDVPAVAERRIVLLDHDVPERVGDEELHGDRLAEVEPALGEAGLVVKVRSLPWLVPTLLLAASRK